MRGDLFARISIGMTAKDDHDITGMLAAWNDGSAEALDRLVSVCRAFQQIRVSRVVIRVIESPD